MDLAKQLAVIDSQMLLHRGALLGLEEAKKLLTEQAQAQAALDAAEKAATEKSDG